MKILGDRQGGSLRRGATGAALLLAGLLAVVLLIVGTGSIVIQALSPGDPITVIQNLSTFGVVVPGEDYPDDFEICIKEADPGDEVDYTLTLNPQGSLPDMRPFLVVVRDPAELDDETDAEADGTAGDYAAAGHLDKDAADECDKWLITLTAPHCEEAYNPYTDPQASGATIDCIQQKPTLDPQTWITGSALGAEVEIIVTNPTSP